MSIQESINSALGAAAATAVAAKRISDQKELKAEQGLLAKEQFHEASADIAKLTGEQEEAEKTLKEKSAISDALELKKPGGKGNTKAALQEKRAAALSEKEAAQRAFSELTDRIEAKRAMMERATTIMKRTGVGGKE